MPKYLSKERKFNQVVPYTPEENPYEIVDGFMVRKDRMTTEKFLEKAFAKHGTVYSYDQVEIPPRNTLKTVVVVTCQFHGDFRIEIGRHLGGTGCPKCQVYKVSNGSRRIANYLQQQNIDYETEKKFPGCINPVTGRSLKFDFFIPQYNLLIEFDGEQHFKPVGFGSSKSKEAKEQDLKFRQARDRAKDDFVRNTDDLYLLRIPYNRAEHTEEIINRAISHIKGEVAFEPVSESPQ